MPVLVIAEHDSTILNSVTSRTITAASQLGTDIHLMVAGNGCERAVEQAQQLAGVTQVLWITFPAGLSPASEDLAATVIAHAPSYSHILAPATSRWKSVMPRVAAKLDVAQISEIVSVESADIFVRPIYAGNLLETVSSLDAIKVITVRTTAFGMADQGDLAPVKKMSGLLAKNRSSVIAQDLNRSGRPELMSASVVVSGGRGLGSAEAFESLLGPLADKLGAAVGASRAAVDSGFVSNDSQIGQTGKVVAPDLYIAVGISGALQHVAGMKDSRVVVAINRDPEAPIFQVADYGLVGDLNELVPALTAALG